MTHVDLDKELYDRTKRFVAFNTIKYRSIKHLVDCAVKEFLDKHEP